MNAPQERMVRLAHYEECILRFAFEYGKASRQLEAAFEAGDTAKEKKLKSLLHIQTLNFQEMAEEYAQDYALAHITDEWRGK